MSQVEAIFQKGVFKPLGEVDLQENQRVRLQVEPLETLTMEAWLKLAQEFQEKIRERHGVLPDSTPDIAADRMR